MQLIGSWKQEDLLKTDLNEDMPSTIQLTEISNY